MIMVFCGRSDAGHLTRVQYSMSMCFGQSLWKELNFPTVSWPEYSTLAGTSEELMSKDTKISSDVAAASTYSLRSLEETAETKHSTYLSRLEALGPPCGVFRLMCVYEYVRGMPCYRFSARLQDDCCMSTPTVESAARLSAASRFQHAQFHSPMEVRGIGMSRPTAEITCQ